MSLRDQQAIQLRRGACHRQRHAALARHRGGVLEVLEHDRDRAEVLQLRGRWDDAARDAEEACALLTARPAAGAAFYRRGEIHRLRGEFTRAEDAYTQAHDPERDLPGTLWEAAQRLKKSKLARDVFGDAFVEHYAATREWEEREFRKSITDWELARYFEII